MNARKELIDGILVFQTYPIERIDKTVGFSCMLKNKISDMTNSFMVFANQLSLNSIYIDSDFQAECSSRYDYSREICSS